MAGISGYILKGQGVIIISDGVRSVIKWTEQTNRKRTFYYLVKLKGKMYTKIYRLKTQECDYWKDSIAKNKEWRNKQNG